MRTPPQGGRGATSAVARLVGKAWAVPLVLLWAGACAPAAFAQDAAVGKAKAAGMCNVCHGPVGIASAPDAPHLAGQSAIYTAAQLKAYRDGSRKHEVMAVMAKMLSDADIANLAAWYASLKIEAKEP